MKNPSIVSLSDATINLSKLVSASSTEDFALGLAWYSTAHTETFLASQAAGADFETFCKVVAILSPATKWNNNIKAAQNLFAQFVGGTSADELLPCGTRYYANARKAFGVIAGTVDFKPTGTGKTFAFYQNIFNPAGAEFITVDFHIYNAATAEKITWAAWTSGEAKVNKNTYQTISDAIRLVATQYNILPLQAQAAIWCAQKSAFPGR